MSKQPEPDYREIFERAVEGIFRTTVDGTIEFVNPALSRIAGYDSPAHFLETRTNVRDLYVDEAERNALIAKLATRGVVSDYEIRLRRPDGAIAWGSVSARALKDEAGRLTGVEGSIVDVTEKKAAQEQLRDAEARYRQLVEQAPAIIYSAGFDDEAWTYVSPQVETVLGFSAAEWLADPKLWRRQLHPDDRTRVVAEKQSMRERAAAGEGTPAVLEYRILARSGREIFVHDTADVVRDESERPVLLQGLMLDVTERKLRERELRESYELLRTVDAERRQLLIRLVKAHEEERRWVAAEVHDGVNQLLVSALYRMRACEDVLETESTDLSHAIALADDALRESWRIIRGLRPSALDELGLGPSLRMLARRTLAGEADVELFADESLSLSTEQEVTLYRIAQEALSNVAKHARAHHVRVSLSRREEAVVLSIEDDGIGFRPEAVEGEAFGFEGMRERAALIGGQLIVSSQTGRGTLLEAVIPEQAGLSV
jgi:two-component system sensor histidine kinase UhpB